MLKSSLCPLHAEKVYGAVVVCLLTKYGAVVAVVIYTLQPTLWYSRLCWVTAGTYVSVLVSLRSSEERGRIREEQRMKAIF